MRLLSLLMLMLLLAGCIESGSLSVPETRMRAIDLSRLKSRMEERKAAPALGELTVPLHNLPAHFARSAEEGMHREVLTLKGLPSTAITWTAALDPYGAEMELQRDAATEVRELSAGSENITVYIREVDGFYSMAAHIGLYTFTAETEDAGEMDRAGIYGSHSEVVEKVFLAGLENALSYDLTLPGE